MCWGGPDYTARADECHKVGYPEILSIKASEYNNIIIEFTEEVSFKTPAISTDFDLRVVDSLGTETKIEYIIPEDAYYYFPGKTLTMFIDDTQMVALS